MSDFDDCIDGIHNIDWNLKLIQIWIFLKFNLNRFRQSFSLDSFNSIVFSLQTCTFFYTFSFSSTISLLFRFFHNHVSLEYIRNRQVRIKTGWVRPYYTFKTKKLELKLRQLQTSVPSWLCQIVSDLGNLEKLSYAIRIWKKKRAKPSIFVSQIFLERIVYIFMRRIWNFMAFICMTLNFVENFWTAVYCIYYSETDFHRMQ